MPFEPVVSHADQVEKRGFAQFNGGPHLCVEVPDGTSTITCRTRDGRLITFSFVPYKTDGPPECVDIRNFHKHGKIELNGDLELPCQHFIVFGTANRQPDIRVTPDMGYTLATCILQK